MTTYDTTPTTPYALGPDQGDHLHFLNHLATVKVRPGEVGAMSAIEFVAPRGFGPPLHCHDNEDEVMVILDGEINFRSGDDEFTGSAGTTVYLPHGVPHTFQVLSETARFSTITAATSGQPRFASMVDTLGEATEGATLPTPTEIDPGQVAAVCGANGIEVLGPPPPPLD
ncbi:MAG: cupin domain-containing protein [Actinomycetota bacterium]